ncbi:MAG: glycosyltransferase family 9 protein [Flavobacteriales bacterium]|jgi:ADP-heptose:LPS heptosyltransferase
MTKILIIRFSSIGDIVLITPLLRAIKEQMKSEVEIHVLTKKSFAGVLEANPHVARIHTIEDNVNAVIPQLRAEHFDRIIDLHSNLRSAQVKRALGVPSTSLHKYNIQKWFWVNFGINKMPNNHIVDRYFETLQPLHITADGKGTEYYIPANKGISEQGLPEIMQRPFIAFAIGAAHEGKRMSPQHLREVCQAIRQPLVLIGGPEDKAMGDEIVSACGKNVYNSCGSWTLHQSADAVRRASIVIAGDTGMMHIASAFRKKIISLWGCTKPGLGMYPYLPDPASIILEPLASASFKPLDYPCSKLGNRCKHGMNNRCIDHITAEQITSAIETLWAPQTAPSVQ